MRQKKTLTAFLALTAFSLSACASIKMPDIDVPGIPEFKQAAAKMVDGYPEVSQAPVRPTDLRSSKEWDAAAKALMTQRDGFDAPELGSAPKTPDAIASEVEALKSQVRAYKLDDPQ